MRKYISENYTDDCMFKRNRWMVDNPSHIIAVFNGKKGGTKYAVDYAKKQRLDTVIINPDNFNITTIENN